MTITRRDESLSGIVVEALDALEEKGEVTVGKIAQKCLDLIDPENDRNNKMVMAAFCYYKHLAREEMIKRYGLRLAKAYNDGRRFRHAIFIYLSPLKDSQSDK